MLDPQLIASNAVTTLQSMEPIVENAIQKASDKGKASVNFDWEKDELESQFVEKYRDDKKIFPEGFEIGFDSKGITVSWEKLM